VEHPNVKTIETYPSCIVQSRDSISVLEIAGDSVHPEFKFAIVIASRIYTRTFGWGPCNARTSTTWPPAWRADL